MEWFTAQIPAAASLEPLLTRLAASIVPVRTVDVPADPARVTEILTELSIDPSRVSDILTEVSTDPAGVFDILEGSRSRRRKGMSSQVRKNGAEGGGGPVRSNRGEGKVPQGGGSNGKRDDTGEGSSGGQAMSLAQYVSELSTFDVVISANSLDDPQTKVRTHTTVREVHNFFFLLFSRGSLTEDLYKSHISR